MKRMMVALALGGALFAVVAFAAASLNLNAGSLSQGQGLVSDCAGGYTVGLDWNTYGANPVRVDSVDVDAPGPECAGATATVEVFDGVNGYAFVDAGSCVLNSAGDCTADFATDPDVAQVDGARVTLAGP